jgi:hypothetical protein
MYITLIHTPREKCKYFCKKHNGKVFCLSKLPVSTFAWIEIFLAAVVFSDSFLEFSPTPVTVSYKRPEECSAHRIQTQIFAYFQKNVPLYS